MNIMKQIYLKINVFIMKVLILFIFFLISQTLNVISYENKILLKVNDQIITTIDISNEIDYLKVINKEIHKLDKKTLIQISSNNLIRDKVKKIELSKYIEEYNINDDFLQSLIKNTYRNLGFNSLDDFQNFLRQKNINIGIIEEKLIIDATWNQFIYEKFKNQIKIDEKKIKDEISNRKTKSYELSEILFNLNQNEKLNEKYELIKKSIASNGFENTAMIYSNSDTSKKGGRIGWITSTAINPTILSALSMIDLNEYTDPITIPGGFLILKINNYKSETVEVDIDKELKKAINIQINAQIKQLSNLYLNKLKKNVIINEL